MAEVVAAASSVIAIIQITDRIIGLCKFYIEATRDTPSDLRVILIETSTLKTLFETLDFLTTNNAGVSSTLNSLSGENGPIEGCRRSVIALEKLFPSGCIQTTGQNRSKKQKVETTIAVLAWPLKQKKASKLLEEMMRCKATITLALTTESIQDIKDIQAKTSEMYDLLTDSQSQEVFRWLQHTDTSPLHYQAQNRYEPGTGEWMLRSPEWTAWLDASHRCLWIHGIPGAGKTVLVSYLIEQIKLHLHQLHKGKGALVSYYCYFGHNQDEAGPFLRWLITQLCRQADMVPGKVYKIYKHGGEPSLVELLSALEDVLNEFEVAYVVVDALDESNPREDLLKILRDLVTNPRFEKLQVLTSSREYIDIEKVMGEFSIPVSMGNPFVEDDIRLHVGCILHSSSKFIRWSQDIRNEVEDALSTGARGMFRWAVCQMDVLQRLKNDRGIIKTALATLPQTLNETYDRIFSMIPEDERLFVHHVLQWIQFHNELYDGEGIPCDVLLQGVQRSTAHMNVRHNERFYDREILRELCGCLINITQEHSRYIPEGPKIFTVSFAHYTVREYLESHRITKSPPAYSTACKDNIMEIMISGAYRIESIEERDGQDVPYSNNSGDSTKVETVDFASYLVGSALLSIIKWPNEVCQQETLCTLAIGLLDPAKSHFKALREAASYIDSTTRLFLDSGWDLESCFWDVRWKSDTCDTDAVHLFNLLLLAVANNQLLALAERFLQGKEIRNFLQTRLTFATDLFIFDGPIVEVFAQLPHVDQSLLKLLLKYGAGSGSDPSKILLLFIGSHDPLGIHDCEGDCLLLQLLELGADPNMIGYRLKPLQIAATTWDMDAVIMLLGAGADPNGCGSRNGVAWDTLSTMSRFSHCPNASPLYICRKFAHDYPASIAENKEKIEEILLRYGAKEFHSESDSDNHINDIQAAPMPAVQTGRLHQLTQISTS